MPWLIELSLKDFFNGLREDEVRTTLMKKKSTRTATGKPFSSLAFSLYPIELAFWGQDGCLANLSRTFLGTIWSARVWFVMKTLRAANGLPWWFYGPWMVYQDDTTGCRWSKRGCKWYACYLIMIHESSHLMQAFSRSTIHDFHWFIRQLTSLYHFLFWT